jgi:hypothetical protein
MPAESPKFTSVGGDSCVPPTMAIAYSTASAASATVGGVALPNELPTAAEAPYPRALGDCRRRPRDARGSRRAGLGGGRRAAGPRPYVRVDFPCNPRLRTPPDGVRREHYVRSVNDVIDVIRLTRTPDLRKVDAPRIARCASSCAVPTIRWRSRRTSRLRYASQRRELCGARVLPRAPTRPLCSLGEPLTFPAGGVGLMPFRSYGVGAFARGRGVARRLHVHDVKPPQPQVWRPRPHIKA